MDTHTAQISPKADMLIARGLHSMIYVKGKVVCVGGVKDRRGLLKTEIYNVEKNEWLQGPETNEEKSRPSLILKDDRFILAIGGDVDETNRLVFERLDLNQPVLLW